MVVSLFNTSLVNPTFKKTSTNMSKAPTMSTNQPQMSKTTDTAASAQARFMATQPKTATPTTPTTKTTTQATPSTKTTTKKPGKSAEEKYQDQLRKEIQKAYQQQIDFLSQQEASLQGQLPGQLEQIGAQYEGLLPGLESQLALQQQAGTQAEEGLKTTTQENIANIRRSGEEQGLRAVQQFGGVAGSSAAQAAGELIAREQLRAQGAAQMQQAQGIQNIQQQLRTIQAEYDSNVNKLNLEKERALQTARNEFNRSLENIRTAKMSAGVTKANQTIQALQDFATRRRAIEDQATNMANSLTMLKAQAEESASLARLQSSLQTPAVTPINFASLFPTNSLQSNEAAKTLQAVLNSGRPLSQFGLAEIGKDPVTGETLYSTSDNAVIDSKGNLRSGYGQQTQIQQQPTTPTTNRPPLGTTLY